MPYRATLLALCERRDAVRDEHAALGCELRRLEGLVYAAARMQRRAHCAAYCRVLLDSLRRCVQPLVIATLLLLVAWPHADVHSAATRADCRRTRTDAAVLSAAGTMWIAQHRGECPTVSVLESNGFAVRSPTSNDAWGTPFTIDCELDTVTVTVSSAGPDRKFHSADDISQ